MDEQIRLCMNRMSLNVITSPWFLFLLVVGGLMGGYITHVTMHAPIEKLLTFTMSWIAGVAIAWLLVIRRLRNVTSRNKKD